MMSVDRKWRMFCRVLERCWSILLCMSIVTISNCVYSSSALRSDLSKCCTTNLWVLSCPTDQKSGPPDPFSLWCHKLTLSWSQLTISRQKMQNVSLSHGIIHVKLLDFQEGRISSLQGGRFCKLQIYYKHVCSSFMPIMVIVFHKN